ncbi:MAG TPA: TetR/AcrR family transcriptional regulator, partial [Turneriella sp.]|nr:TetR/AcrR family transcriptional regulator [Turneriella sp.]
ESLLSAGLDIIGRKGDKAATVRAICTEAGLTQRYYYEAFADAEEMLIEIYQRQLAKVESQLIQAAFSPGSISEKPHQVLLAFLALLESDPRIGRVIFFEILGVSARVDKVYIAGSEKFVGLITAALIPFVNKLSRPLDAEIIARAAVGAVINVAGFWQLNGFKPDKKKIADNIAGVISVLGEKLAV